MAEIDGTKLGVVAADFMARLEEWFKEPPLVDTENPRIETVMIIARVITGDDEDGREFPFMACSDPSRIHQQGLLRAAIKRIEAEYWTDDGDEEDDE
jgi:hypothetical protein